MDDPDFRSQYARAREDQATGLFDLMLDIAEGDAPVDLTALEVKLRGEGETELAVVADPMARDRLRIDTIKWGASKLLPKIYGDKISADVNVTQEATRLSSPRCCGGWTSCPIEAHDD